MKKTLKTREILLTFEKPFKNEFISDDFLLISQDSFILIESPHHFLFILLHLLCSWLLDTQIEILTKQD